MESSTKLKIGITSAAFALSCIGVSYLLYKHKYRLRDAVEALHYLNIKIVTSEDFCDEVVNEIRRRSKLHHAVGFDCEWVTAKGKRHPVALIQMSSFDGFCGLFRLSHMKTIPNSLKELLEDESIYKVGVAPIDDAKYLNHDYSVHLKSTLDIRHIVQISGYDAGGLGLLCKTLLRVILDKHWKIRCSDWQAEKLTHRQINYAAADAHVSIKMFVNLINENNRGGWFSTLYRNSGIDVWSNLDKVCGNYLDVKFTDKQTVNSKKNNKRNLINESKINNEVLNERYPHATRSKPLYHNCFLEAPDGEMLCTCDNKKAQWYVEKGLADIVKEEPLTVRLRFEPSGRSVGDVGRYYQLTKENKCVVCGDTNSYIRKNVVPREYRKYFPEVMKDHSSHDVVLLCALCHQTSNIRDQPQRARLATLCKAPLSAKYYNRCVEDVTAKKIRSAARALLYQPREHVLPLARHCELEDLVLQHYPRHTHITKQLLEEAATLRIAIDNPDYESHGLKVVEHFARQGSDGGLLRLEVLWREHFLNSMHPKYMPELWSVTHSEERCALVTTVDAFRSKRQAKYKAKGEIE